MSIAGIAKEVTTIVVSAWFFGDELTPLNITGVGITICGTSFPTSPFASSCFLPNLIPLAVLLNPSPALTQSRSPYTCHITPS